MAGVTIYRWIPPRDNGPPLASPDPSRPVLPIVDTGVRDQAAPTSTPGGRRSRYSATSFRNPIASTMAPRSFPLMAMSTWFTMTRTSSTSTIRRITDSSSIPRTAARKFSHRVHGGDLFIALAFDDSHQQLTSHYPGDTGLVTLNAGQSGRQVPEDRFDGSRIQPRDSGSGSDHVPFREDPRVNPITRARPTPS